MPRSQLLELYARHLGVIEEARVAFGPGFNVITGETGAGKTLLLGALNLSLGGEGTASRYAITSDTSAAAVFASPSGERLFQREASAQGRLRSTLDGGLANAEALREAASNLIVIHGQHDSLTLRHRSEIVRLIDAYGPVNTTLLTRLRGDIRDCESRLAGAGGDREERLRFMELISFQATEIRDAAIADPNELSGLLESLTQLTAIAAMQSQLHNVIEQLDGDHDAAVLTQFSTSLQRIPPDDAVAEARTALVEALEASREGVRQLRRLTNVDETDDERIALLSNRVELLQSLVRKYGPSLSAVMESGVVLEQQLAEMNALMDDLDSVEARLIDLRAQETAESRRVLRERELAAVALTESVRRQLPRVALPHASLRFVVDGTDGSDAQILFRPNPGQAEGPLQSLASGGELSRVLLAVSLVADSDHLVSVFDEVDAGIGGQVAQQIGTCLAELGQSQQVIAVTHLASVAAKATHHFVIQKDVREGRTVTTVTEVIGPYRVREIARMLVGDAVTEEAVALAQRLLSAAN